MSKSKKSPSGGVDCCVFGEVNNPETDSIDVPLGSEFQCPCGCVMKLGGAYLAAHWNEKLKRKCESASCGQLFWVRSGRVTLKGAPWATVKHAFGT